MPAKTPLVAICMATFDPDPALLQRQIASIREQTHEAWVCLISDDGSSDERFEQLRALTAEDPRFELSRADQQLGFYLNFERALKMAPPEAQFIALADLGDAQRVYSDMRIVDEASGVVADTFWRGRRNNYTNLASLLLANTVTG